MLKDGYDTTSRRGGARKKPAAKSGARVITDRLAHVTAGWAVA